MKILIEAEAFCFGPSAIAASIVSDLTSRGFSVDYVINESEVLVSDRLLVNQFVSFQSADAKLLNKYDYVVVVMDWEFAKKCVEAGCKVVFVDALAWFWKNIDPVVNMFESYLAINFIGVQEVVSKIQNPNSFVIGQCIKPISKVPKSDAGVFSIGGVTNPLLANDSASRYAKIMVDCITGMKIRVLVCGNRSLDRRLRTESKDQFDSSLRSAKFFVGTSGLGHITECISYSIPSLFLPPVNDSQHQQLQLLSHRSSSWSQISWEDLGYDIDWSLSQENITVQIKNCIDSLMTNTQALDILNSRVEQFVTNYQTSNDLSQLSDWWGYEGQKAVGDWILGNTITRSLTPQQLFSDNQVINSVTESFEYFFHTTRPENLELILKSGAIKSNPQPILYGDRLGPRGKLFGQLTSYLDAQKLMDLSGCRFPIFVFKSSVINKAKNWHLSAQYRSGKLSLECISPFNQIPLDLERLALQNETVVDVDISLADCVAIIIPDFWSEKLRNLLIEYGYDIPVLEFNIPEIVLETAKEFGSKKLYSKSSGLILAYAKWKFGEESVNYTTVLKREVCS
jgi:hypothetical protein